MREEAGEKVLGKANSNPGAKAFVSTSTKGSVTGRHVDLPTNAASASQPHTPAQNVNRTPLQPPPELLQPGWTPIKTIALDAWLSQYPDKNVAHDLSVGFRYGFKLDYNGPRVARDAPNLKSAVQAPHVVNDYLSKEIKKGRISGPYSTRPLDNLIINPVGVVPKKTPGKFRIIQHLSYPDGQSVNDFIDPDLCTVKYTSIDDAVRMIQRLSRGALLGKADCAQAFRQIPIHPSDFELLGIFWEFKYYVDRCLPMGCSRACARWESFSTFLEWCTKVKSQNDSVKHYLDDWIFAGKAGTNDCVELMSHFRELCLEIGVPLAEDKWEGPTTVLTFLGLELDSVKQEIRLPRAKLEDLRTRLHALRTRSKATLREIQSMSGLLNFACRAVVPGRAFMRRLVDLTRNVKQPHHHIRLTKGAKDDLSMWISFLDSFNGTSMFLESHWVSNADIHLFTDASGTIGMGAYFQGHWTHARWDGRFPDEVNSNQITFLELFPIVVALHIWGDQMANKKVLLRCDNEAVVHIINRQSSKCPRVMILLRRLVLQCLRCNILFRASHIAGERNEISDSLSRFQMTRFRSLAPNADEEPVPIPPLLWQV